MIKGIKYSAVLVALHGGRVELRRVVVKALKSGSVGIQKPCSEPRAFTCMFLCFIVCYIKSINKLLYQVFW